VPTRDEWRQQEVLVAYERRARGDGQGSLGGGLGEGGGGGAHGAVGDARDKPKNLFDQFKDSYQGALDAQAREGRSRPEKTRDDAARGCAPRCWRGRREWKREEGGERTRASEDENRRSKTTR
jgi:hypothetical protein